MDTIDSLVHYATFQGYHILNNSIPSFSQVDCAFSCLCEEITDLDVWLIWVQYQFYHLFYKLWALILALKWKSYHEHYRVIVQIKWASIRKAFVQCLTHSNIQQVFLFSLSAFAHVTSTAWNAFSAQSALQRLLLQNLP